VLGDRSGILAASTSAGPAFSGWRSGGNIYGDMLINASSGLLRRGELERSGFLPSKRAFYETGGMRL